MTVRAAVWACRRVGRDNETVAAVARDLGCGWHTVMRAVREHGQPLVDDPARLDGVRQLGVDETAFLRARRVRHTSYVSGMVDTATGRLLDVVQGRTAAALGDWLEERPDDWKAAIGVVALDPHRGYANAIGQHLGHATLVVDRFHAIRLANRAVDDVRRRVQQETTGHRGRKHDPLYRIRRTLLQIADTLVDLQWTRLEAAWDFADPDGRSMTPGRSRNWPMTSTTPRRCMTPARRWPTVPVGRRQWCARSRPTGRHLLPLGGPRSWRSTPPAAPPTAPPRPAT
ncbi:Mobile element protein [Euzebya pacifica]|uniref:Mobile element protein n=1 Tax=Euzebya pacifica TaxID=1608957 RepID=A0A346XWP7_9ACTN|nr:transposase [Euzebya pacifica]AXV06644.1 Mobile element protein [Euzebya pacifica]